MDGRMAHRPLEVEEETPYPQWMMLRHLCAPQAHNQWMKTCNLELLASERVIHPRYAMVHASAERGARGQQSPVSHGLDQSEMWSAVLCSALVLGEMALHNFSSPFLSSFPGYLGHPGLYPPVTVSPYLQHNLQPPRLPEPQRQNRQTYVSSTQRPPPSPYQQPPHHLATPAPAKSYVSQDTRYTRVNSGSPGSGKTSVHAVIDYDDDFEDGDDYYDEPDLEELPPSLRHNPAPTVTPIQGPILVKNGSVPVVPLYSYPTLNNGSLVQIPVSLHVHFVFLFCYL